jgi:hypothetical protein
MKNSMDNYGLFNTLINSKDVNDNKQVGTDVND